MTLLPVQCQCGTVKGTVRRPRRLTRCICYCKDCRAFARFLGRSADILDEKGGTDVVQIVPADITFSQGREALACMRLTRRGMIRWYTTCCNTPIGNTLDNPKISFIGLIHTCLKIGGQSAQQSLGPVDARVNTASALGAVESERLKTVWVILKFMTLLPRARFGKRPPNVFVSADGTPLPPPRVLTADELARVRST
jgi:uncharacterized protein DUF6151